MLRPSNGFLGSSRATYRANVRAERIKALSQVTRFFKGTISWAVGGVVQLAVLWGLPFAYLVASYLALDLPARWLTHRDAYGRWGLLMFAAAAAITAVGVSRAVRDAPPVAPVRPRFAKAMLGLSFVAALLCTIGDLAS